MQEIRAFTDNTRWRFCPRKENPGNLLTRGLPAHRQSRLQLCWHGPRLLASPSRLWPEFGENIDVEEGSLYKMETRPHVNGSAVNSRPSVTPLIDCEWFTILTKPLRATAGNLRYVKKVKKTSVRNGHLFAKKRKQGERYLLRVEQIERTS